ncbi:MAG TPA: sigma-70 family RNA polymerase sigma factor [Sphingomonas sp.]|nr:sigma-70 family RNA polymerase sigma factor [Sphingomonas sp.]
MGGGEPQAADGLQAVFLANRPALLRYVTARGGADAAEDVLHDLWLKLADARPGPVGNPLSYLFRAAENLLRDRHRARRQAALRERAWTEASGPAESGVSDAPFGERALIAREELARVSAAIEALDERARAAFRLHRLEGMAQRAIAAALGVSLSTVESDLRRAYRAVLAAREGSNEA